MDPKNWHNQNALKLLTLVSCELLVHGTVLFGVFIAFSSLKSIEQALQAIDWVKHLRTEVLRLKGFPYAHTDDVTLEHSWNKDSFESRAIWLFFGRRTVITDHGWPVATFNSIHFVQNVHSVNTSTLYM